ncbi:ATP synthase subunit B [Lyngbya sp. PCC 8106]|nr:ATP synthase subunit B [Lyngbya sp. PCC 8106]
MKNSFLLIKILPTSRPPDLPTSRPPDLPTSPPPHKSSFRVRTRTVLPVVGGNFPGTEADTDDSRAGLVKVKLKS